MLVRSRFAILKTFSILALFVLASCKKDNKLPADCSNLTGWLKTGHQWVYEFQSPFVIADTITLTVNGEIDPGVFEISTVADDTTLYAVSTRYMKPCKNDIYISNQRSMAIAFITYKVDGDIGEKWNYSYPTSRGFTATIASEIAAKEVPVTVPAGTFSCLQIIEEITSTDPSALVQYSVYFLNNEHGLIKVVSSTDEYALVRKNY
jgi:hypothetical protein